MKRIAMTNKMGGGFPPPYNYIKLLKYEEVCNLV